MIDLTALGFTLIGGRLDYIDGRASARSSTSGARTSSISSSHRRQMPRIVPRTHTDIQGFNIRHWRDNGLRFWAVAISMSTNLSNSATNSRRRWDEQKRLSLL